MSESERTLARQGPKQGEKWEAMLIENCRRFAAGQPLLNLVDKEKMVLNKNVHSGLRRARDRKRLLWWPQAARHRPRIFTLDIFTRRKNVTVNLSTVTQA